MNILVLYIADYGIYHAKYIKKWDTAWALNSYLVPQRKFNQHLLHKHSRF